MLLPEAANGMAACGVPRSGLGDAKRAASFFQPSVARDSCRRSADDDKLGCNLAAARQRKLQRLPPLLAALHRVTPWMDGHTWATSRLLPGADTPPFFFWVLSEQSRFEATMMPTPITSQLGCKHPIQYWSELAGAGFWKSYGQKVSLLTRKLSRVNCAARFWCP